MKLIYSQCKEAVARVLNMTVDDDRLPGYVNRASERLVEAMKAKGTVSRYRVCLSESCLALPRQIETPEAFAIDGTAGIIRNGWYEFIGYGPGIACADCCFSNQMILGDDVSSFDNVTGTGKKLAIYSDVNEDAEGYIILRFYDENGQWVRSQDAGVWIDGEKLTLPAAGNYVYTDNFCMPGGFVAAIKTLTNGTIRLFEYEVSSGDLKPLAFYEPDELVPRYRAVLIPGLTGISAAGNGEACTKRTVIIRAKQRFVPVANDDDFLQIESVEAIRLGVQAVAKEEKDLLADAANYWAMAGRVLDNQLLHVQGAGAIQPIVIQQVGICGAAVPNMI